MYRLMIVDDEANIRDSITRLINLESMGFTLVATATNGIEALEYLEEATVEVLITDINMPFLDGLGLTARLRKRGNNCKVIFLTGYDEFEYAKEAVTLNVEKYILKPITKAELTEVLLEVKKQLDETFDQTRRIKILQDEFDKNKKLYSERSLVDILEGKLPSEALRETLENTGQIIDNSCEFMAIAMEIKVRADIVKYQFDSDYVLFFYAIIDYVKKLLEDSGTFLVLKGSENKIIVLCLNCSKMINLEQLFNQVIRSLNLTFDIDVTVGFGADYRQLEEMAKSYNQALLSLEYQLIDGNNRVIIYREKSSNDNVDEKKIFDNIDKIVEGINNNNIELIDNRIALFFSTLNFCRVEIEMFRTYTLNLVVKIFEQYDKRFGADNTILDFGLVDAIVNSQSEHELKQRIMDHVHDICSKIEESKQNERLSIVNEAEKYLEQNYSDPQLDLSKLSEALHVSISYISKEFKRVKGKTVIEYLTDVRMNKAKELLKDTDMKVFEISLNIGYEDANYFSYNFRKHIGVSPLKYRKGD